MTFRQTKRAVVSGDAGFLGAYLVNRLKQVEARHATVIMLSEQTETQCDLGGTRV